MRGFILIVWLVSGAFACAGTWTVRNLSATNCPLGVNYGGGVVVHEVVASGCVVIEGQALRDSAGSVTITSNAVVQVSSDGVWHYLAPVAETELWEWRACLLFTSGMVVGALLGLSLVPKG